MSGTIFIAARLTRGDKFLYDIRMTEQSSGMWCSVFCKSVATDEDGSRFLWKAGTYLPDFSVTSQKIVIFHTFLCPCKNVQIYLSSSEQDNENYNFFILKNFFQ